MDSTIDPGAFRSPSEQDEPAKAQAEAQPQASTAAASPAPAATLRYVGDAAFGAFEHLNPQGQPQGFQIEVLRALEPVLGTRIDIALMPRRQAEAAFRTGQANLTAMVDTPERRTWALFAQPHATATMAVFVRKGSPEPQGLQGLARLRVAIPDGEPMRSTLAMLFPQAPQGWVPRPDAAAVLDALLAGEADAALLARAHADPLLANDSLPGIVPTELVFRVQSFAFAVPPDQTALLDRVNAALNTLEHDGTLEALRVRWLGSHREKAERLSLRKGVARQRRWLRWMGGVSAMALALMGALLWREGPSGSSAWVRALAAVSLVGLLFASAAAWWRGLRLRYERSRREAAESALARANNQLEHKYALPPDPMLLIERETGRLQFTNDSFERLLGVAPGQFRGATLRELGAHVDMQALHGLVYRFSDQESLDAEPVRVTRADGLVCDCLLSANLLQVGGDWHVLCVLHDISSQLALDRELRQSYDTLLGEVSRLRKDLDGATAGRQVAERTLQEFTRAVAHDLRAPLTSLKGLVQLLRERLSAGATTEAEEYTGHIESTALRMSSMVTALTALASVGRQPLRRSSVNMQQQAQDTWALLCAASPERQVEFSLESLPVADAEPDLVAQVWQNLLQNAWKYTGKVTPAQVRVDSHRDARGVWYRVTDNGAGFDMSQAGQLFQPFRRLHSNSEFEGTGVGLSLVRRIVEHHGGEIRLRSVPCVGTVAEFTLDPLPSTLGGMA